MFKRMWNSKANKAAMIAIPAGIFAGAVMYGVLAAIGIKTGLAGFAVLSLISWGYATASARKMLD